MAKAAKAVVAAEPTRARITTRDAVTAFNAQAKLWHRSSICMVSSAAVAIIVGTFAEPKVLADEMVQMLRERVAETGIKEAQIYKYLGLSRALVQHIAADFTVGGPVVDVLQAKTPEDAMNVIVAFLEKKKVRSLDALGVLVGKYQRSDRDDDEGSDGSGGENGNVTQLPIQPSRSAAAAIVQRIVSEPAVLQAIDEDALMASYVKAGNTSPLKLIAEAIAYINSVRECNTLIAKLEKKRDALRSSKTPRAA